MDNSLDFSGKTVIVTGGGKGVGKDRGTGKRGQHESEVNAVLQSLLDSAIPRMSETLFALARCRDARLALPSLRSP